jgi:hypothetical protein
LFQFVKATNQIGNDCYDDDDVDIDDGDFYVLMMLMLMLMDAQELHEKPRLQLLGFGVVRVTNDVRLVHTQSPSRHRILNHRYSWEGGRCVALGARILN